MVANTQQYLIVFYFQLDGRYLSRIKHPLRRDFRNATHLGDFLFGVLQTLTFYQYPSYRLMKVGLSAIGPFLPILDGFMISQTMMQVRVCILRPFYFALAIFPRFLSTNTWHMIHINLTIGFTHSLNVMVCARFHAGEVHVCGHVGIMLLERHLF